MGSARSGIASDRAIDGVLWTLAGLGAAATVWFSLVASPPGVPSLPGVDKVLHGLAYFTTLVCALLAAVWRPGRGPGPFPGAAAVLVVGAIAMGGAIEVLQGFTATRQPELWDWIAEIVAALAAWGLVRWLRVRFPTGP